MTQAMHDQDLKAKLIARARADTAFRQALLSQPKATIEQEFEIVLPEDLEVKVVEETTDTLYLVLPPAEGELSEAELEGVSGGIIAILIGRSEQPKSPGSGVITKELD